MPGLRQETRGFNQSGRKRGGPEMIITVGNTKGGVGKSTLALNIAVARAHAGRNVWLIDGDRQKSTLTAISVRSSAEVSPGIACAQYSDAQTLVGQMKQQAGRFDDVIIDAGGRDSGALRAAMVLSDTLLIPCYPRSADLWAMDDIAALIDEARAICPGPACYAFLSKADSGESIDNADIAAALAEYTQWQFIDAPIIERKVYANAFGLGLAITEMRRKDKKAIAEFNKLLSILD